MCAVKIGSIGKFDLNPRGELWRQDENRFGHKLLSKFGWSQGKGLGKNENGIAENLKVRLKIGNTGVGWNEKLPFEVDYREYDAVLEDLGKRYQKSSQIKEECIGLEKRSQQFKNRIHYRKFVRGKDISRYSEKDMSCIFLSKEPEKKSEIAPKESAVTNLESQPINTAAEESVPTFNSQLSIADYFAQKMKNKLGFNFNTSKESKSKEEAPQSETDATSKKRKSESKSNKKAKRIKREPEINPSVENLSNAEENTLESPSPLKETPEENLDSSEQFKNMEDSYNYEKRKKKKKPNKKTKNVCNDNKTEQEIENDFPEEKHVVQEYLTKNKNPDFVCSQKRNSNSVKECGIISEEISGKQKKKGKKSTKAKEYYLEETEFSTGTEKVLSPSEYDVEKNCYDECTSKSVKGKKQSGKEGKKHKTSLKSCLKRCLSNSNQYNFKPKQSVSFCEDISYRIIENSFNQIDYDIVLETNEQLPSCSDEESTDSEVVNETKNVEADSDPFLSGEPSESDCYEYSDVVIDNDVPECFKLPKLSSTNYDSWLETQRIAARMKVYKNMVKKIKKHPILRKTNLLDIKGYANWGL